MAAQPEEAPYEPPSVPPAEEATWDIMIAPGEELRVRSRTLRGRMVDFAIMQMTELGWGPWVEVARIDCCHGTVHRHLFTREGGVLKDHQTIRTLSVDASPQVIEEAFDISMEEFLAEWEENIRRWNSGK
ncbi:hypothetical protein ACFUJT_07450 [Streptomyces griseoincarnatus]